MDVGVAVSLGAGVCVAVGGCVGVLVAVAVAVAVGCMGVSVGGGKVAEGRAGVELGAPWFAALQAVRRKSIIMMRTSFGELFGLRMFFP